MRLVVISHQSLDDLSRVVHEVRAAAAAAPHRAAAAAAAGISGPVPMMLRTLAKVNVCV